MFTKYKEHYKVIVCDKCGEEHNEKMNHAELEEYNRKAELMYKANENRNEEFQINPEWEASEDSSMRFLFDDPDMYKAVNIGPAPINNLETTNHNPVRNDRAKRGRRTLI